MAESRAVHLLAQYLECPVEVAAAHWEQAIGAFKQAMAEFGIGNHPDGKCPTAGCPCALLAAPVTARAHELLGLED